jgi:Domain of unknown function (DUF4249)
MKLKITAINRLLLLIVSAIALGSCERDVAIDLPYEGNKIVMNALIMRDSLVYARVTNSSELNTNSSFQTPAGAAISLYENDVLKETMQRKMINGYEYFVSSFRSQEGKKYTLKATASGLDAAEGSDRIPAKPSFGVEEYKEVTVNGTVEYRVTIRINDPAGEKNYYRLRLYGADTNLSATGPRVLVRKYDRQYFDVDNLASNAAFDVFGDNEYREVFFTDDRFDGRDVSLTLNLSYNNGSTYLAPELVQLTRDAYRYLQSRDNQVTNEGNPFTEAVVVYTNIAGGYGIVGGMADSVAVVRKR